jgi:uncharacterized protein YydD (DUF2326 family)
MKLSALYCNNPEVFPRIRFNAGLSVVLAEIRDERNQDVDTHNLGKTTIARIIDFCLLRGMTKDFFLQKNAELFDEFVFFLELRTDTGRYLTIRRAVASERRVAVTQHDDAQRDFTDDELKEWDHADVPFDRARQLLDGLLGYDCLAPWSFRIPLGYFLRVQKDYQDVFRLDKHRGKDVDWKAPLAHILGLDGKSVARGYEIDADIEEKKAAIGQLRKQLVGVADEPDKLAGLISIKEQEVRGIEAQVEGFDFREAEAEINKELVEETETAIARLNEEKYYVSREADDIEQSLGDKIRFNVKQTKKLFDEAGIAFGDQLVKDYDDLLAFHRAVTKERDQFLRKELKELRSQVESLDVELEELNRKRVEALDILREHETFQKYRKLTQRLVVLRADLEALYRQRRQMKKLKTSEAQVRILAAERQACVDKVEEEIEKQPDRYTEIRTAFTQIIRTVTGRPAVLASSINNSGNIEFSAEFVTRKGDATSENEGWSYKKLLCVAFDLAILRSYANEAFPHFAFHDGVFEGLDNRKKLNLITEMQSLADAGVQQVVTLIDSDLPQTADGGRFAFDDDLVVRVLHDQGDEGLLFRMAPW